MFNEIKSSSSSSSRRQTVVSSVCLNHMKKQGRIQTIKKGVPFLELQLHAA